MNPEGGSIMRCVRHPSQFFTGFCSSCLAERLSSVNGSAEKTRKSLDGHQNEITEVSGGNAFPDVERKSGGGGGDRVRVRKTLQYLFQLDDDGYSKASGGVSGGDDDDKSRSGITKPVVGNGFPEDGCTDRTGVSTSYSAAVDVNVGAHVGKKKIRNLSGSEDSKERPVPFWLGSVFSKTRLVWRMRGASGKKATHEDGQSGGGAAEQMESKIHSRRSLDGSSFHERSRVSWEAPRHSWDGSMVSKALACSFACLDEREGACCRVKRSLPEEATISEPIPTNDTIYISKINNMMSANGKPPSPYRGRPEDSQLAVEVSSIIRRKSNRWSKVWDRSITSPFKDFGKKREHVLGRSLSESWRQCHKDKNMESMASVNGTGPSSTVKNQSVNKSMNAVNGETPNLRPDLQSQKSEFRIRRSRSVHYSSPGNLDNGLLRFYLTPLRSSRRSTSKRRIRTSRSFARGIFGL